MKQQVEAQRSSVSARGCVMFSISSASLIRAANYDMSFNKSLRPHLHETPSRTGLIQFGIDLKILQLFTGERSQMIMCLHGNDPGSIIPMPRLFMKTWACAICCLDDPKAPLWKPLDCLFQLASFCICASLGSIQPFTGGCIKIDLHYFRILIQFRIDPFFSQANVFSVIFPSLCGYAAPFLLEFF